MRIILTFTSQSLESSTSHMLMSTSNWLLLMRVFIWVLRGALKGLGRFFVFRVMGQLPIQDVIMF